MCGFAGVIGAGEIADPAGVRAALAHRGPDATAAWQEPGLHLISARLTHWEEGASTQPYASESGAVAVLNGELYNLQHLRNHLGLPDASEIEVLVAGLDREGAAFLNEVDGQFAALVRPHREGPAYAVRDRFGICPLYYTDVDGAVIVGSNLASVTAAAGRDWQLSVPGVASILAEWAPGGELSPFDGIHQLGRGGILTLANGRVVASERWYARGSGLNTDGDLASLELALRDAVGIRLRSTGRVACLLSGGIDSTVIGAIAGEAGLDVAMGLTLEGEDTVAARQRQVARTVGMELVQHRLTPDEVVGLLEEYVSTRRVPLVRLGPVGMMALARHARSIGVRGVLSGEGADELFCGYDSFRVLAARAGLFGPVDGLDWGMFGIPEFGASHSVTWRRAYWRGMIGLTGSQATRRATLLAPMAAMLGERLRGVVSVPAHAEEAQTDPRLILEDRRRQDLENLLASYLLIVQGDHAWMEESVELRPPYLAAPVADWALDQDPRSLISLPAGKLPIRSLLERLAERNPGLAELNFEKAAFRVDAAFVLRDPAAFSRLIDHIRRSPADMMDTTAVVRRAERSLATGRCSELESMIYLFTASLGILAD